MDLMTSDPERSREFDASLFGWRYEAGDEEIYGGYVTAFVDGAPVAGMMKNDPASGNPDVWSTYLRVEDIAAAAEAVMAAGGKVMMPPMEVPGQGHMAMFIDAGGAVVGAWQFGGHTGFQLKGEPGAPFWHEPHTLEYAHQVKFYQDVFSWDTSVMSDSEDLRYTTLKSGDGSRAGIMDASFYLPEGVLSNGQIYFGVADADAVEETAVSLGAQVIHPAEDSLSAAWPRWQIRRERFSRSPKRRP